MTYKSIMRQSPHLQTRVADMTEDEYQAKLDECRRWWNTVNWSDLQSSGRYPIKQAIFCGVDSVTGQFFTQWLRLHFGAEKVQSMHWLRDVPGTTSELDLDVLLKSRAPVIAACWSMERAKRTIPAYEAARGWPIGSVRAYEAFAPYWSTLKQQGWVPPGDFV